MTEPAELPVLPEEYAVSLHHGGMLIDEIAAKTGLSVAAIDAAVERGRRHPTARASARSLGPSGNRQPDQPPKSTAELLEWGEQHDNLRVRAAARRAREGLAALNHRWVTETEARRAALEVEALSARLDAAKELARTTSLAIAPLKTIPVVSKDPEDATEAEIRQWAADAGRTVNRRGRISHQLRAEYIAERTGTLFPAA